MSVPWTFEYVDTSYELEPENPTEEAFDVKYFITVLEIFKHHYGDEMMCRVRDDYIEPCNVPISREYILNETAILDMLKDRVD